MRNLIYTNPNGQTFTFGSDLVIESVEGLGYPGLDIQSQKAPYQDGVSYIDGRFNPRQIQVTAVLQVLEPSNITAKKREISLKLSPRGQGFDPSTKETILGTLAYAEDGVTYDRWIDCFCESAVYSNREYRDGFQRVQLSFFCPNPFWYGAEVTEGMDQVFNIEQVSWRGMAKNTTTYVAVGGSTSRAAYSSDGINWKPSITPATDYFAVAWGAGVFCAVGSNVCATSPDGITWTSRTIAGGMRAIVWTGSQFVAVGSSSACATSSDGITWTTRTITTGDYSSVAWNGTLLAAVGSNVCATSPDGITWTSRTVTANARTAITWNGSLFVAVGTNIATTSPDGITWTDRTIAAGTLNAITWNGSFFVAVGLNRCSTSPDGITWTSRVIQPDDYKAIITTGYGLTAIGTLAITKSVDGITWESLRSRIVSDQKAVAYGAGKYVSVGNAFFVSGDGIIWDYTPGFPAGGGIAKSVIWNGSLFVAVGETLFGCFTSPDGINWSNRSITGSHESVVWNGSLFVAVGANRVTTSPDGIVWTTRTIPTGTYYSVTWDSRQFVAVGVNVCATSPDGITWTSRTIPSGDYRSIAWNGSILVAVGTVTACATSPDGITWTTRTIVSGFKYACIWNGSVFTVVGSSLATTSPDGITWTTRTIASGTYYALAQSNQIVAIGNSVIATSTDGITWSTPTSSDYAKTITVTGDVEAPMIASVPIAGFESNTNITISDGVVWSGTGTPPSPYTMALNTSSLSKSPVIVDTTFGQKSVTHFGNNIISRFTGGKFWSLRPGTRYVNVRNSGNPGDAPTIKYRPRYLGV